MLLRPRAYRAGRLQVVNRGITRHAKQQALNIFHAWVADQVHVRLGTKYKCRGAHSTKCCGGYNAMSRKRTKFWNRGTTSN